jgi:microcystin-dependent protein
MENSSLYTVFDKGLYRITTEKIVMSSDIDPDTITSGSSVSVMSNVLGNIYSGKTSFSNNETGYILGLDNGVAKFYIGTDTSYFNFDGTNCILSGDFIISGDIISSNYVAGTSGYKLEYATGIGYLNSAVISGAITTTAGSSITTTYLSGLVGLSNTNISAQGWTNTCVFSATDYRVVAWATGVITTAAGTAYNITGANTGNMASTTYIYLDIAVSTTLLQITTTATTAIGSGKILVAVATPNTDTTSKAQYQVYGGVGGVRLFVDNISANSASTNEFISNSAQIANLVVTNAKINDLAANKITAGTGIINNLSVLSTLTMGSAATDGTIQSYGWNGTANGFQILGGATPSISLIGGTITGGTIQTASSGARITITSNGLIGYNSSNIAKIYINNPSESTYGDIYVNSPTESPSILFANRPTLSQNYSSNQVFISNQIYLVDGSEYTDASSLFKVVNETPNVEATITENASGTLSLDRAFGEYTLTASKNFKIEIDGIGSPNTFKWSDDGGSTWDATEVAITGSAQSLINGISIIFSATTGGVSGDYWTFSTGAITSTTSKKICNISQNNYNFSGTILYINNVGSGGYDIYSNNWNVENDGTINCSSIVPTTEIAVADGGTGKSSWTQYLIPYADTTTSFSQIAIGTSGQVLTSNGAGSAPSFQTLSGIPTGSIFNWATSSAPTGYLICDGSAVSRTTYSALFAVISTTYGSGDGSTTFNVPNLKGKVVVGYNSAETEFDALGETGGTKTHTLTEAELAAHTHTVTNGVTAGLSSLGGGGSINVGQVTTSSTGSGNAHNNLQPYIVLNAIIKY